MTVQAIIDDTSNIRKRNNLSINEHAQLIRLCMIKSFVLDEVVKKTADLFDSVESAQAAIKQIRVVMARGTTNLIEAKRLFPTEEEKLAILRQSEAYWEQRGLEQAYIRARQEEMGADFGSRCDPDGGELRPCPKCNGQGFIYKYRSVDDGACFRCRGTGTIPQLR
jgi:hypothetical protein